MPAYVQDEWRATRNLTVTFGMRYNLELGSIEQNNHYVYLDTTSPSPLRVPGYNLVGGLAFTRSERTFPPRGAGRPQQLGSSRGSRLANRQ